MGTLILTAEGAVTYSRVKTAEYPVPFDYKFYSGEKNGVLVGLRIKRIWVASFGDGVRALRFWNERALSHKHPDYTQPPYYCNAHEAPVIHRERSAMVRF